MNTFKFIGTIHSLNKNQKHELLNNSNGTKCLRFIIRENETNSAIVQLFSDKLYNNEIFVFSNKKRIKINYDERFNDNLLKNISYASKYILNDGNNNYEFVWKEDFMQAAIDLMNAMPRSTIYEITGEYILSNYNNQNYNNFNIKTIKIANNLRPELVLNLDLFYNRYSLDLKDKRNKFILNAYIQQYCYENKRKEFYPLQVQFITNRFDFSNPTDIEIIQHRKENLFPNIEDGWVKATWEAQYVKGAQLILPPLETLPKAVQFEIINAGRDIKEYYQNIVGEASEYICLTRPNNTLNKNGLVYIKTDISNSDFESLINKNYKNSENTMEFIASNEAIENPFN